MIREEQYVIQDEPEYTWKLNTYRRGSITLPFLHLDFHKFTPTTFKKILKAWSLFRSSVKGPLFALSNQDDIAKWERFIRHFGFQYYKEVTCPDGKIRPVYISKE